MKAGDGILFGQIGVWLLAIAEMAYEVRGLHLLGAVVCTVMALVLCGVALFAEPFRSKWWDRQSVNRALLSLFVVFFAWGMALGSHPINPV